MDVIKFRIRHDDGRVEELVSETGRVLVGSGSHCEVRLPLGAARVEHVLVHSTPAGWRAIARSFDPAPRIDGIDFTEAPILGECVLSIGETRIDVVPSAQASSESTHLRAKGGSASRLYVYALVGLAGWGAILFLHSGAKKPAAEPDKVPPLFSASSETCPQTEPQQAIFAAETRLALALGKAERSPFYPEDGVAAVPLYESAAACFRVGHEDGDAAEATAAAERLREEATERFRVHRLRMQRALADEEWTSARHEAGVLLAFFPPGGGGEYATWLSNVRRRIQLRYGGKGEKQT